MSLQGGQMPIGTQTDNIMAAYEKEKELAKRKKKDNSLLTQGFQPQKKRKTLLNGDNPYV